MSLPPADFEEPQKRDESNQEQSERRHPRKRVVLTEHQLATILTAAKATQNDKLLEVVTKALARSFVTEKTTKPQPVEAPPDPQLASHVKALEAQAAELSSRLDAIRRQAAKQLVNQTKSDLKHSIQSFQLEPSKISSSIPPHPPFPPSVKSSSEKLGPQPKTIKKINTKIVDTERRAQNLSVILQRLTDQANTKSPGDVSLSINADWTINVNDLQQSRTPDRNLEPAESGYGSPIPSHPRPRDYSDECLSPFITPRSKMRRRTARQLNAIAPLKLDMPR